MLTLELFLLLDSVLVMLDKALRGRDFELGDATVVQLVDCLIKSLRVDSLALHLQLTI